MKWGYIFPLGDVEIEWKLMVLELLFSFNRGSTREGLEGAIAPPVIETC